MGRKTWESAEVAGKPLPRRLNIVITRRADYAVVDGVKVATSLDAALAIAAETPDVETTFVVGGAEIFGEAFVHRELRYVYLTRRRRTARQVDEAQLACANASRKISAPPTTNVVSTPALRRDRERRVDRAETSTPSGARQASRGVITMLSRRGSGLARRPPRIPRSCDPCTVTLRLPSLAVARDSLEVREVTPVAWPGQRVRLADDQSRSAATTMSNTSTLLPSNQQRTS